MRVINLQNNKLVLFFLKISLTVFLVCIPGLIAFGQSDQTSQNETPANSKASPEKPVLQPVFTNYKGLTIGATASDVKEKLGKPKIDDPDGFYYIFGKEEQVQIRLDENQKVNIIAVTYSEKSENAPKYEDVFGKDVPLVSKPDGSIYNLVRYPEAGFWVAYSTTTGDDPTVTITIQKI
ncbi:MAG TPA: hypothetical protein PKY82_15625 [Pyrinomonadaceae bacterium]|nr:hypothetical protein [Pyrinomonadaceae bacterium]